MSMDLAVIFYTPEVHSVKEIFNNLDFFKVKNFNFVKGKIKTVRQATHWGKCCKRHI